MSLERLGETIEFGEAILDLIERQGWIVHRRRAFAGEGVILLATLGEVEQRAAGPDVSGAAIALFHRVVPYFGSAYEREAERLREHEQLRLPA